MNTPITFNINMGLPLWTYIFLPIILPLVGLGIALYTWIMTPIKCAKVIIDRVKSV
jgi:hypothetical protein